MFKRGSARPVCGRGERLDDVANGRGLRESHNNLAMVARTPEHLVEAMFLHSWGVRSQGSTAPTSRLCIERAG